MYNFSRGIYREDRPCGCSYLVYIYICGEKSRPIDQLEVTKAGPGRIYTVASPSACPSCGRKSKISMFDSCTFKTKIVCQGGSNSSVVCTQERNLALTRHSSVYHMHQLKTLPSCRGHLFAPIQISLSRQAKV